MVATLKSLIPVVAFERRASCSSSWPSAHRALCAKRLARVGVGLTEASDARELAGMPRLSEASAEARRYGWHWFQGETGKRALARAREERALLLSGLETTDRNDVQHARALLNIRNGVGDMRLPELRALYAQAQLARIAREG